MDTYIQSQVCRYVYMYANNVCVHVHTYVCISVCNVNVSNMSFKIYLPQLQKKEIRCAFDTSENNVGMSICLYVSKYVVIWLRTLESYSQHNSNSCSYNSIARHKLLLYNKWIIIIELWKKKLKIWCENNEGHRADVLSNTDPMSV